MYTCFFVLLFLQTVGNKLQIAPTYHTIYAEESIPTFFLFFRLDTCLLQNLELSMCDKVKKKIHTA